MKNLFKAEKFQTIMIILVVTAIITGCSNLSANATANAQIPTSSHSASMAQTAAKSWETLITQEEVALASYSPVSDTGIRLKAIDNTWSSVSGIEAGTYKEQLDEKIAYIEECYSTQKTPFLITEDITLEEATNMAGIAYMYENSPVYREMSDTSNIRLGYGDGTFYKYGDRAVSYERLVFSLQEMSEINIKVSCTLDKGKQSVWLVSPNGEIVRQTDASSCLDEQIVINNTEPGLWRIILVNYFDNDFQMGGQFNLQGSISVYNPDKK